MCGRVASVAWWACAVDDVEKRLKNLQKELKKRETEAYLSPEKAEEARQEQKIYHFVYGQLPIEQMEVVPKLLKMLYLEHEADSVEAQIQDLLRAEAAAAAAAPIVAPIAAAS